MAQPWRWCAACRELSGGRCAEHAQMLGMPLYTSLAVEKGMPDYFNSDKIAIRKVENGYVLTGRWNHIERELIAKTMDEVVEVLWRSYTDSNIGESCPYTKVDSGS